VIAAEDVRCGQQAAVVTEALSWLGTPYRHQACEKGVGADCLGVVRGVYGALMGKVPPIPPYPRVLREGEPLLNAARDHLEPANEPSAGDVVLFRLRRRGPASHCGVLIAADRFVHALAGRSVTSTAYSPYWRARTAAAFRFPEAP